MTGNAQRHVPYVYVVAGALVDYARVHRRKFTAAQAAKELGVSVSWITKAIKIVRDIRVGDTSTLVCHPQGRGLPWLYQLTRGPADFHWYQDYKLRDEETRMETSYHMAKTHRNVAPDARTIEGKRAKLMEKALGRLLEDLADLTNGVGP